MELYMLMPRVYISGPMTLGDTEKHVAHAEDVMKLLMVSGFAVLCPQLTAKVPWCDDIPHADWIRNDLPWVSVADVVYRIAGESKGASEECVYAKGLGIPVYYDLQQLILDVKMISKGTDDK